MTDKSAVSLTEIPIAKTFAAIVDEIQSKVNASDMKSAVDLELTFNQVSLDSKGVPLFTRHKEQSQMQIKLATRIIPSQ